jgi:hypothetical protein
MTSKNTAQPKPDASVTGCDATRRAVLAKRASGIPWREIAASLGVKPGTLCRWAKTGWEPADNAIRLRLGLPLKTVEAPPCPKCGGLHLAKRCTADKMAPAYRVEVEKFITWARQREAVYLAQPHPGAVYDKHGHIVHVQKG